MYEAISTKVEIQMNKFIKAGTVMQVRSSSYLPVTIESMECTELHSSLGPPPPPSPSMQSPGAYDRQS